MTAETCEQCRFDGSRWTDQDALRSLGVVTPRLQTAVEHLDDATLRSRPEPEVWSPLEYMWHIGEAFRLIGNYVGCIAEGITSPTGMARPSVASPDDPRFTASTSEVLAEVGQDARNLADLARSIDDWSRWVELRGQARDVGWWIRHANHEIEHHLDDIGRVVVALGRGSARRSGRVDNLHVSGGGVPKTPVEGFRIDWDGPVGDVQATRAHHGRPWQAVTLWSSELIDRLRQEGHEVAPGRAGENITVSGLDWSDLRPGSRIRVGEALLRVTAHAEPCSKIAPWFIDGDSRRVDHFRHPGWSRLYAGVVSPGEVRSGDAVEVEPEV